MDNILLKVRAENAYAKGKMSITGADVYVTDKRLIVIYVGNPSITFAWFGLIGYGISRYINRKKMGNLSINELNQILQEDKRSFDLHYVTMESLELKPDWMYCTLKMIVNGEKHSITLTKKRAGELRTALMSVVPDKLKQGIIA